jgi:hypothetical protein
MMLLNTARLQYARRHYGAWFEKMLLMLMPENRRMAAEED